MALAQTPAAKPAATSHARLLVLEKAAAHARLIDPVTREVTARIPVGNGPHEVAVSPDGRTAVVCDYGDQKPGQTLTVIDVPNQKAVATFALEGEDRVGEETKVRAFLRPHGIRFLPSGTQVVVTSESSRRLLVVDLAQQKVLRALPTAQPTLHMVELAPTGDLAYGTSIQDGTLGVFALDGSASTARLVATGEGAEGLAVSLVDGTVWVGNRAEDTLSIVDGKKGEVMQQLETASFPIRVAFVPDGSHALVSCAEAGCVQVFEAKERKLVRTIDLLADKTELSPVPIGICIEPDGKRAWIACQRGEFLAVIDLQTFALVDRVPGGAGPDGMAFATWADPAETEPQKKG